jgi:hypothetical protein
MRWLIVLAVEILVAFTLTAAVNADFGRIDVSSPAAYRAM